MKYYYPEHVEGYERLRREGLTAWGELHGEEGFDNFCSRGFLEAVLPRLQFDTPRPTALEYGCGTGPGACFLAVHGFEVDAIDLVPDAIEVARRIAKERGLDITFGVGDVCELSSEGRQFDIVVDSYCLQCIVFDEERAGLFEAVKSRLKPKGYYLVSTAVLDDEHEALIGAQTVHDHSTGREYVAYGDGLLEPDTGIVLRRFVGDRETYPDVVVVNGATFLPNRRHLRPSDLVAELDAAGFDMAYHHTDHPGSLVFVHKGTGQHLSDS